MANNEANNLVPVSKNLKIKISNVTLAQPLKDFDLLK